MWQPSGRLARPMPVSKALPTCPVCNERVELETSKTDEHGQAIHEECYVRKLRESMANGRLTPE